MTTMFVKPIWEDRLRHLGAAVEVRLEATEVRLFKKLTYTKTLAACVCERFLYLVKSVVVNGVVVAGN